MLGHGRRERRRHTVTTDADDLTWLHPAHASPQLAAIGRVEAERRLTAKLEPETRSALLSRPLTAQAFGAAVRAQWGIEQQLQWLLDIACHEDQRRIRHGHAAANLAVLRHLARKVLHHLPSRRASSIKARPSALARITTTSAASSPPFRCVGPTQVVVVPRAGHVVMYDRPREFERALLDFLAADAEGDGHTARDTSADV